MVRVGIKCLCTSILNGGHIVCLKDCKNLCDYLIVLTQPDDVIRKLKQYNPPVPLEERLLILESIRYVDQVSVYYHKTEDNWVKDFKQHKLYPRFGQDAKLIMFHSEELRNNKKIPCAKVADEIVFIPRRYSSTTDIVNQILRDRR